ncbi:MAG: FtsW/RodA/SpoVE family cell cycle protein [Lachnospiraceae bacterium]|jgi:cell division protein FtsW
MTDTAASASARTDGRGGIFSRITGWLRSHIVRGPLNYRILFTVMFLNVLGIIMIYSTSFYLFKDPFRLLRQQVTYVVIGVAAMLITARVDYHFWVRWIGPFGAILSVILILLLKTGLGVHSLGATRWLKIGPISFQVAEPVKTLFMLFYAWVISRSRLSNKFSIALYWGATLVCAALFLVISDNMSTAMILFLIGAVVNFVNRPGYRRYIAVILLGIAAVFLLVLYVESQPASSASGSENFRLVRIRAFLHPYDEEYAQGEALQGLKALTAIGSGGFWGRGLGRGLVKLTLSEPYNDYILAVIGEELGAFGILVLMVLFVYLLTQILLVAQRAADTAGRVFCIGVFAQIAVQTLLNIFVVIHWFPTTGVSLPFISYGGASVIFLLIEIGIVFNIDNTAKNRRYRRDAEKEIDEIDRRRALQELIR